MAKSKTKPKKKIRRTYERVTLRDIAERCDVSKATVCRVLNDRLHEFPVSDELVERVKRAAAEMGYRPNRLAQAVRKQRTNLIGLSFYGVDYRQLPPSHVLQDRQVLGEYISVMLTHPGFSEYDIVIHARPEEKEEPFGVSDFKTDLLDGMIYVAPSEGHQEFLDIASASFPIVLMGDFPRAEQFVPCIDINNRKEAGKVVHHLVDTGRKKILMLVPREISNQHSIQLRVRGYREAHDELGLPLREEWIQMVGEEPDSLVDFFKQLPFFKEIDAVFTPVDYLAIRAIQALKELGCHVPRDVAVAGFDDSSAGRLNDPSLTSVRLPVEQEVYQSTDLLLGILNKERPYTPGFIEMEAELIVRESTSL